MMSHRKVVLVFSPRGTWRCSELPDIRRQTDPCPVSQWVRWMYAWTSPCVLAWTQS